MRVASSEARTLSYKPQPTADGYGVRQNIWSLHSDVIFTPHSKSNERRRFVCSFYFVVRDAAERGVRFFQYLAMLLLLWSMCVVVRREIAEIDRKLRRSTTYIRTCTKFSVIIIKHIGM